MATALASQLQALARQRQPALPAALKKGKASLLFDYQKAADVDVQTIYDIACQGLEDLVRLEPRFRSYRDTLFSRGSVDINPELQTAEVLAKLDERILAFCRLLSNHFLAPAAFKALEYLIRRYKANERNVDALMLAALPYHATNEFVRLVQTLALGPPGSLWGWLAKMQTSGASLPRDLLAQRCANDRQLLLFVCKAAGQLGGAAGGSSGSASRPHSRTFLSFYAVLLCEVLAVMPALREDFLSALLPHLLEGLGRGAAQDYRAATLMAVAELCSRTNLSRDFAKALLSTMLKHTEPVPEHVRTVLMVMAHLAVTQPHIKTLSEKILKYLFALPNAISELKSLTLRGNIRVGPLLLLLSRSLAAGMTTSKGTSGSSSGDGARGRCESEALALAHAGVLAGNPARLLASTLLEAGGAIAADAEVQDGRRKVLKVLDQRYPETTDEAVNAFLEPLREQRRKAAAAAKASSAETEGKHKRRKTHHGGQAAAASDSDDDDDGAVETAEAAGAGLSAEDRARFEFVRSTFGSGGCFSAPCGGTMMTLTAALAAPQAAVRRMALQQLDADLSSSAASTAAADEGEGAAADAAATTEARSALTAAALARLRDDDLGVVVAALGLSCLRQLPPAALLPALQPLVARLGDFLYGPAKLPQLKAARKAARKVTSLIRHTVAAASSQELRDSAALLLLGLLLPSQRDPRVAVEAARAVAALGSPMFSGLAEAVPQLESHLTGDDAKDGPTGAAKGKGKTKGKGKLPDGAAAAHDKGARKGSQRAAAAAIERDIVAALSKALSTDPDARAAEALRLVQASAAAVAAPASGAVDGGAAAALRAQHLLLLASHAAATSACSTTRAAKHAAGPTALVRAAVHLSQVLLPYACLSSSPVASDDQHWTALFAEQLSVGDGLPTAAHSSAVQSDAASAHAALILGCLHANLTRLHEAASDADADPTAARHVLHLLSALDCSPEKLADLPLLVVTRRILPAARAGFLAGLYASPAAAASDAAPALLQCLALRVQAELAAAAAAGSAAAGGRQASTPASAAGNIGGWCSTLLPALASRIAAVRSAACDCLAAVAQLLEAGRATVGAHLPARTAAALCSSLLAERKLLCSDAEAVVVLLRAALQGGGAAAAAAAAPTPTPSKKRGAKAAAAPAGQDARLSLSGALASEVGAYLVRCLRDLDADAVGTNTASVVLSCLLPAHEAPAVDLELFSAGCEFLNRLATRLQIEPLAATALDAEVAGQLFRLFTPSAAAAAVASGRDGCMGVLTEIAEIFLPARAAASPPAVESLAAVRLAAVRTITHEFFAALPPQSDAAGMIFAELMSRLEGDPDEAVRGAARAALEAIPLSASFVVRLLQPACAAAPPPSDAAAADNQSDRAKKKSKKADGAAAAGAEAAGETAPPPQPLDPAALRDAIMALEFLQWRTGIAQPGQLVSVLQALLRRLLPFVGSIASTLDAEGGAAAAGDEDAAEGGSAAAEAGAASGGGEGKSALAGYAATLALTSLASLARQAGEAEADGDVERQRVSSLLDIDLAVRVAREAPDAAVRNAALGLLAELATRMPESALAHVLQVLAVVNASAALQDDEHSRAVGATALAAVVPAWVAAGHRPAALWGQVVSALPALPPHRRLDLLLALLRALPVEEGLSDGLLVLLQHAADPKAQVQVAPTPVPAPAAAAGSKTPKSPSKSKKARATPAAAQNGLEAAATQGALAGPPPSEWLPELASQLALQVGLSERLACCARVMELALTASRQQPHSPLPRVVVAFVTAQLKLKAAVAAAGASLRRPEPDPVLEAACRRLMEAALAQMQLLQPDAVAAAQGSHASSPRSAASSLNRAVLAASRGLYGLFAALQGVMAADAYLQALLTLAEHPADKVKRRAIKLFTDKVRGVRSEIQDQIELPQRVRDAKLRQASDAAARACALFPKVLRAAEGGEEAAGGDDGGASPLTRQLALLALSAIAAEFGAQQHETLLAGVPAVLAATKDPHASIRASALAAVAAFVRALGPRLVPVLPSTVAAAVAAADSAWARLSRAGAGGDAVMEDAEAHPSDTASSGDEGSASDDSEGDELAEDRNRQRSRRAGSAGGSRRSGEDEAALELSSALACLNALVETVGGFLSPHLPAVLSILLNPRVLGCRVAGCDKFAAGIRARLPAAVPPRLLLPALYDRLQPCLDAAGDAADAASAAAPAAALLQMVASAASAMESKAAVQYHEHMFVFLLRALDVRQRRPPPLAAHGDEAIDAVEAAAVRALVALVMKLSEARFKPLFLRMIEWASTVSVPEGPGGEPTYLGRMVALYSAVSALADRLRSVLVPYFRYLLDSCVQHLSGDDAFSKPRSTKKHKKAAAVSAAPAAAAGGSGGDAAAAAGGAAAAAVSFQESQLRLSWLLRLRIVRALHRCFLHDTVGFVDAERFARLHPALVTQLDAEPPATASAFLLAPAHADADLDSYVTLGATTRAYTAPDGAASAGPLGAAVVGCLLALAVAANSDALWKPLNHGTLMLTRSPSARTRALALEVVAQLVERLREEYLVLLPESLPFMSELLEDIDGAVATRVREVISALEEISGEKLDEYLKV